MIRVNNVNMLTDSVNAKSGGNTREIGTKKPMLTMLTYFGVTPRKKTGQHVNISGLPLKTGGTAREIALTA